MNQVLTNNCYNTNHQDSGGHEKEIIKIVYDLPGTKQVIHYYHTGKGFPTKSTWLKAMKAGFHASLPMLTATAILFRTLDIAGFALMHNDC